MVFLGLLYIHGPPKVGEVWTTIPFNPQKVCYSTYVGGPGNPKP